VVAEVAGEVAGEVAATLRHALVAAAVRLDAAGLNVGSSGNLAVRVDGGLLVTPSGIPPGALTTADVVLLDPAGGVVHPTGRVPTSEWRLHVELLARRPDVGAVVHTHSPEATAAAAVGAAVPAVHYVVARFGAAELPCAPYATYGTADLAAAVAATLGTTGTACLMANHGAVAVAGDLDAAVALALDVEWFCGVHRRAVQLGVPAVLPAEEIERVAALAATYGQPRPHRPDPPGRRS
jgi:L-fuculose-phosphate aldolase